MPTPITPFNFSQTFSRFVLFVSLVCISASTIAQSPMWQWVHHEGGANGDNPSKLVSDAAGNLYVCGTTRSAIYNFGDTTIAGHGSSDCYVAKYDSVGNLRWAKSIGGSNEDWGTGIALDAQSNIYITGYFKSDTLICNGSLLYNNGHNYDDIFIAKFGANGNLIWAKNFGGTYEETASGVAVDATNHVYITGSFTDPTLPIGSTTLTHIAQDDIWIAQLDASGNPLWAKCIGGAQDDVPHAICTDGSGNFVIAGSYSSPTLTFGTTTLTKTSGFMDDVFVAKFNSAGNPTWAVTGGGIYEDVAEDIVQDNNGNLYITGYFYATATFGTATVVSQGSVDAFAAKYNSNGNIQWIKDFGGTELEYGNGIAVDAVGNVYFTGSFDTQSLTFGSLHLESIYGFENYFIASLNPQGVPRWVKDNSVDLDESYGQDVAVSTAGDKLYASGYYRNTSTFEDSTFNNFGYEDTYIGKLTFTIGIDEPEFAQFINIFPNPATESIKISSPVAIDELIVMNTEGKILSVQDPHALSVQLPVEASGIYFVKMIFKDAVVVRKVISVK